MQKIIDFMGDESLWKTLVPNVTIRRRTSRHVPTHPVAYFIDSHWTAYKPGHGIFDPYDHYQRPGTHKFCQTFVMMYLLDKLPPPVSSYSEYDARAMEFIRNVIKHLPDEHPAFSYDSKKILTNIYGQ